jgi:hypothetical protein
VIASTGLNAAINATVFRVVTSPIFGTFRNLPPSYASQTWGQFGVVLGISKIESVLLVLQVSTKDNRYTYILKHPSVPFSDENRAIFHDRL